MDVFNAVAMIGFLSLLVFTFQPNIAACAFVLIFPATTVATGSTINTKESERN
jgi:hypothetical protein